MNKKIMFSISPIQLKMIISSVFGLGGVVAAGVLAAETGDPRYWALLSSIPVSACAVTFFSAGIAKCCGQKQNQVAPASGDRLEPDIKNLDTNGLIEVIVDPAVASAGATIASTNSVSSNTSSKSEGLRNDSEPMVVSFP